MRDVLALLETELQAAFEVKDKDALHRYAVLMLERFAARDQVKERTEAMTESIDRLSTKMKEEFSKVHGGYSPHRRAV